MTRGAESKASSRGTDSSFVRKHNEILQQERDEQAALEREQGTWYENNKAKME